MGLTERALRELMRILETGKFPSDDSAASDLYFVVREALENRRTLSDRTAERDQLRILYNTARDGMREVGELLETCRIELAESRAEVERLTRDFHALDTLAGEQCPHCDNTGTAISSNQAGDEYTMRCCCEHGKNRDKQPTAAEVKP